MPAQQEIVELFDADVVNFWVFSPPIPEDVRGKLDLKNGLCFPADGGNMESVNCHRLFKNVSEDTNRLALYKQNKDQKLGKDRKYRGYIHAVVGTILSIHIDGTHFKLKHNPVPELPPDPENYAHCDLELHATSKSRKNKAKEDLYEKFSPMVAYIAPDNVAAVSNL